MIIGLIGLKNSGKSTIFSSLTGIETDISPFPSHSIEPHLGIVDVVDERLQKLKEIYQPKKIVYASVEFMDFAGITEDSGKHEYFSGQNLASIKTADALGIVVRNFADSIISEALGEPDPVRDINIIDTELIISDLIIVENRLEKIELSKKRGIKETSLIIEEQALLKAREHLNDNKPLYSLNFNDDEEKSIRGFQFLSKKPCLYIINSDENNFGKNDSIFSAENSLDIIEFAGKFELELSKLDPNEAKEFMEDFGLDSSTRERLIKFAYNKLGYISFFTVGSKEVHAWNLQKGQNALEAAGTIHSDMERGFIRAECYNFSDLLHHGSEKELRNHGLLRLEGKNYIVSDGDVITIRFNV